MSKEYFDCIYNLWTGFVGKATCEAGYLKCDGLSCPMYEPKKDAKPMTNYDRLVSKTPEELSQFFFKDPAHLYMKTPQETLEWLKSPAEEKHDYMETI